MGVALVHAIRAAVEILTRRALRPSTMPYYPAAMARFRNPAHVSLLVVFSFGAACHSWKTADISSGVAPVVAGERAVRVTQRDQSREIVERPRVERDSLTGYGKNAARRFAVALPDVARVEHWRGDTGRTTLVVVAATLGLSLVFSDRPQ